MPEISAAPHTLSRRKFAPVRACSAVVAGSVLIILSGCQTTTSAPSAPVQVIQPERTPLTVSKFSSNRGSLPADWAERMQPLFIQARKLVEQHTGANLSQVTLNLASDRDITAEVSHETERLIHSQFNDQQFANRFLDSVMRGQQGTYAALYATRKSEVMVSLPLLQNYQRSLPNNKDVQESAILALLIHELVHAADDQRYGIHENRDLNFRASFAQSAAFEGHAQWVTRTICTQSNCLLGLEALDQFMFGRNNPPNQLTQTVQAISRNVLEYSYVEGERFIAKLAARPNGQRLIDELLSNPPQDPIQILDPKSYPNSQREQHNQQLIDAATTMNHPWVKAPWAGVQTSPLKGVNLRTDPNRRNAAVDGFTRLITSMVAIQLYDQTTAGLTPIELTILRTESSETAMLFAKTLHENTRVEGARLSQSKALERMSTNDAIAPAMLYMTTERAADDQTYYTFIGVSGDNVVQMAGVGMNDTLFVDYVRKLLLALTVQSDESLAQLNVTQH